MIRPIQNRFTPLYYSSEIKRNSSLSGDVVTFCGKPKLQRVLNQDIWQNDTLKPGIAIRLKMLADNFQKSLAMDFKREDLAIVGSMANFNYNKTSDIDLHLVTDFSKYSVDKRLLTDYFKVKRDMFNYTNSFRIKGHPIEVSVEDLGGLTYSSGRYSIERGEWIKKPILDESIVLPDVKSDLRYIELRKRLDDCIENKRLEQITPLFREIYALRQAGLSQNGEKSELSAGNLIFKALRNEGYIKKMIDLSYAALNNLISL